MKNVVILGTFLLSLSFLSACATKNAAQVPNWLENPARNQAVGSCSTHALGKHKQKECAMARARLELAARQGVEIKSISLIIEKANQMGSANSLNQHTSQQVNSKLKIRLIEIYHDKNQDIIWVLIEEEN